MKPTDMTLMERMNLTESEIERRKHLFDFMDEDCERLKTLKPFMERRAAPIVEAFYDAQLQKSEIAEVIGDAQTLGRLKIFMAEYVTSLFAGVYANDYVNGRLRIGVTHKRIKISPKLYMSGVRLLQSILNEELDQWAVESEAKHSELKAIRSSLHKITLFDAQLVFDAYIDGFRSEVDAARREVEAYSEGLEFHPTVSLMERASKDELTGLFNRGALYDFLPREIAAARQYRLPLCLVSLDLDDFKQINDTHGHAAGDEVLVAIAKAIREVVRRVDIVCRYGGDEFCILMPRTEIADAERACERLITAFEVACDHDVSVSIGIVQTGPTEISHEDTLLKIADERLYKAKQAVRTDVRSQICAD